MCIVYIIAWLLAGTVVLALNMLALLTYKIILQICICTKKHSQYWVLGYKGTEKGFINRKLLSIFSKLERPSLFLLAS
jgi:hypothetical protein